MDDPWTIDGPWIVTAGGGTSECFSVPICGSDPDATVAKAAPVPDWAIVEHWVVDSPTGLPIHQACGSSTYVEMWCQPGDAISFWASDYDWTRPENLISEYYYVGTKLVGILRL